MTESVIDTIKINDYRPYSFLENFKYYIRYGDFITGISLGFMPIIMLFLVDDLKSRLLFGYASFLVIFFVLWNYFVVIKRARTEICVRKEDVGGEDPFLLCLTLARKFGREFGFAYEYTTKKLISDIVVGSKGSITISIEITKNLLRIYPEIGEFHTHHTEMQHDYDVSMSYTDLRSFFFGSMCVEMSIGHTYSNKYFVITNDQIINDPMFWKNGKIRRKLIKKDYEFNSDSMYCKKNIKD